MRRLAQVTTRVLGVGANAWRERRALASFASATSDYTGENIRDVVAAVYFSDEPVNLYQIRQWYAAFERLSSEIEIVIIARNARAANILRQETQLQVVLLRRMAEIEDWVSRQNLRLVLYVNQNMRNFQMLRIPHPAHVFISHGESDKTYMSSNQLKAYDYVLAAGKAAKERIVSEIIEFNVERSLILIGRPQARLSEPSQEAQSVAAIRSTGKTVLYAPTWEGDRPSMSYSSLLTHGELLVEYMLNQGAGQLIYRPHPRTGVSDYRFKKADENIRREISRHNARHPNSRHVVDDSPKFDWQLEELDICITDVSAVAYDWLATGKPLFIAAARASVAQLNSKIFDVVPMLHARDIGQLFELAEHADSSQLRASRVELSEFYFGEPEEDPLRKFVETCRFIVNQRDRQLSAMKRV